MPPKPSISTTTTMTTKGGAGRPSAPTHFLCIPLVTASSRPQLSASISAFKDDVCSPPPAGFGLPEDSIRPVGTLHLTLGVMSFPTSLLLNSRNNNHNNNEDDNNNQHEGTDEQRNSLERAKELLRGLRLRDIWRTACREAKERTARMPGGSEGAREAQEGKQEEEIKITLRGLASMQTPPTRAAVLYAPPVDPQGKLYGFCERVRNEFRDGGFMGDDGGRPLLLHATVVNTIYVKGGKGSNSKGGRGGRGEGGRGRAGGRAVGGGGGGRERLTFDATEIIDRYEDQVWMEEVRLEGVAICKMGAKKVLNEQGEETGDEKYEVVEEVAF